MSIAIGRTVARKTDRLFFTGMALASALTLILGFFPSYFHRSAELYSLTLLYQLHGAFFTAWVALLVAQTALVAAHRTDIHRTLGVAGVVLAAVVFVVGVAVSVETLRRNGGPFGDDPRKFFAIPLGDIIVFGASDFETFNNAGLHPLTDIMTSQLKPLNASLSAAFDISPQHLICPFLRNGRDVLDSNPGRLAIWTSPNNNGFAAVRA